MEQANMKKLYLIRGLPGSGKSTLAKTIAAGIPTTAQIHFEADMYFVDETGLYRFDPTQLHRAHEWCLQSAGTALDQLGVAIVSNTFTTIRELHPYFTLAAAHSIVPTVILTENTWGNTHGVPEETLERMKARFVYDLSPLFNSPKEIETC